MAELDEVAEGQSGPPLAHSPLVSMVAPAMPTSRRTSATLAKAFGLFGFALGGMTGFSVAQGISQVLVTSVFTFVGGVLLSYAGFRKVLRAAGQPAGLDPVRMSVAVGCLSLGLVAGT